MKIVFLQALIFIILFSSCTVEKRLYRKGFYFHSNVQHSCNSEFQKKFIENNSDSVIQIARPVFATDSTPKGLVSLKTKLVIENKICPEEKPAIKKLRKLNAKQNNSKFKRLAPPDEKDNYRVRPLHIFFSGLLALAILSIAIWLFILGGWWILAAVLACMLADSIAFLAFLTIDETEVAELPLLKKIIFKIGLVFIFTVAILLFPLSILWVLGISHFMYFGD